MGVEIVTVQRPGRHVETGKRYGFFDNTSGQILSPLFRSSVRANKFKDWLDGSLSQYTNAELVEKKGEFRESVGWPTKEEKPVM